MRDREITTTATNTLPHSPARTLPQAEEPVANGDSNGVTDDDDRRSSSSIDHPLGGVANGDDEKSNMLKQLVNQPLASVGVSTTTSANGAPAATGGTAMVVGRPRLPGGLGVEDAKKLVNEKIGGGGGPGAIRARREQAELAAQVSRDKKRNATIAKKGGKGAPYYDSNGHLVGGHLDTARLMDEIRPKAAAASAAHRTFSANETGMGQLKVSGSRTDAASLLRPPRAVRHCHATGPPRMCAMPDALEAATKNAVERRSHPTTHCPSALVRTWQGSTDSDTESNVKIQLPYKVKDHTDDSHVHLSSRYDDTTTRRYSCTTWVYRYH